MIHQGADLGPCDSMVFALSQAQGLGRYGSEGLDHRGGDIDFVWRAKESLMDKNTPELGLEG